MCKKEKYEKHRNVLVFFLNLRNARYSYFSGTVLRNPKHLVGSFLRLGDSRITGHGHFARQGHVTFVQFRQYAKKSEKFFTQISEKVLTNFIKRGIM